MNSCLSTYQWASHCIHTYNNLYTIVTCLLLHYSSTYELIIRLYIHEKVVLYFLIILLNKLSHTTHKSILHNNLKAQC